MPHPFVTVAVPCLDEEEHIESFLRSIDAQDWPRDRLEILVADGMSLDATREILGRHAASDPRIQLIDNPGRLASAGLNECIRRARGEVIVRMDVRAQYAADFLSRCIEALERSGADNAGGAARLEAETFFERCVAAALRSPLGTGGAKHAAPREDGFVDTVWLGAFRRTVFERVGLFDPRAVANEDAELDQRIVDSGGKVFISRDIVAHYRPRGTVRALASISSTVVAERAPC
jgi:cellulose synthase/poly-beta-1,6-N-acetylglucosamine synthase-like glycosyltransferase